MILIFYIYLTVGCPETVVKNRSFYPWEPHDQEVLERNRNFCERKFKDSKCVKEFIKMDVQTYWITCSRVNENKL